MDFDISEFENPKIRVGKCYQEAAHAVFAHHAGLEVYDVYVTPAGEGNSDISLPADPNPLFIPELATVLLAGEYAESRIWDVHKPESFGDFERQARYDPDCFDFPRAHSLLQLAAGLPDNPWGDLKGCHRVAAEATASNIALWWPKIEAVAQRLERGERLGGEAVANIVAGLR